MDANAHSKIFGAKDQNARGNTLDEFIIAENLVALNKGDILLSAIVGGIPVSLTSLLGALRWPTLLANGKLTLKKITSVTTTA